MGNPAPEIWAETATATRELREAFAARGIVLPELSANVPAVIAGLAFVYLGNVDAETARRLAAVLRGDR